MTGVVWVSVWVWLAWGLGIRSLAADFSITGAWPGAARLGDLRSVTVTSLAGTPHAVVAAGVTGVHVFRLGTGAPTWLGAYDTPGTAQAVAVRGNSAYVADGIAGMILLDLSSPGEPRRLGGYDTGGYVADVAVSGDRVWLADREGALVSLDVTLPGNPTEVLRYQTTGQSLQVAVSPGRLFVWDGFEGVLALSEGSMARLGAWTRYTDLRSIVAAPSGGLLALADGRAGLALVDFSGTAPVLAGRWVAGGTARAAAFDGARLWLADGAAGLTVLDPSWRPVPALKASLVTESDVGGVAAVGDGRAVVLEDSAGVSLVALEADGRLALRGRRPLDGQVRDVAGVSGYAVLADGRSGLRVLDVVKEAQPTALAWVAPLSTTDLQALVVQGARVYAASGIGGLEVFDLTHPLAPTRLGLYRDAGGGLDVRALAVRDTRAYLGSASGELRIVDVSNPLAPVRLGGVPTGGPILGVTVVGSAAYVAADTGGLAIVDVGNPVNPVVVGRREFAGRVRGVTTDGRYLYVAADHAGLQVLDLQPAAGPVRVGGVDTSGLAGRIVWERGHVYVAEGEGGVRMVRVSDPARPLVVGGFDTDGYAEGLAFVNGRLAVADRSRFLMFGIPGVTAVPNAAPSFRARTNVVVLEDAGPVVIPNWATSIVAGPATDAGQTVRFGPVSTSSPTSFAVAPVVSPDGALRFTPAADAFGSVECRVWLEDDGGKAGGGVDRSAETVFRIVLTPVNDPPRMNAVAEVEWPSRRLGTNLVLTGIVAGPPNEAYPVQNVTIRVISDTPEGVPSDPLVRYTPGTSSATVSLRSEINWSGRAWLTVILEDDGGLEGGGIARSESRIRVTVRPATSAPFATVDFPANGAVLEPGVPVAVRTSADAPGVGLARVDLLVDGVVLESRLRPPSTDVWTWERPERGSHTLSVKVIDVQGREAVSAPIRVVVASRPTIVGGEDLTLPEDTASEPLVFRVSDADSPPEQLDLRFVVGNGSLLPPASFQVEGDGEERRVVVTPAPEASGETWVDAVVTDPDGLTAVRRFTVRISALNDPPVAFLVEPRPGAVFEFGQTILLRAVVGDVDGDPIQRVEFVVGDQPVGVAEREPYAVSWLADRPGELELSARALDGPGLEGRSAPVTIRVGTPPNRPPTVVVVPESLEFAEDSAGGRLLLEVSDDRTAVERLSVVAGVVEEGEAGMGPVAPSNLVVSSEGGRWQMDVRSRPEASGTSVVWIEVSDTEGGRVTNRVPIRVTAVNDPPFVVLREPADGAVFGPEAGGAATVSVRVEAGDIEERLERVEVWVDERLAHVWTSPPFVWAWTETVSGEHLVVAKARDAEGLEVSTRAARIRVDLPPPDRPPAIRGGEPVRVFQDGTSAPLPFEVSDDLTPLDGLIVTAVARDAVLLPGMGLRLGGSGGSRTLVVTPAAGRSGTTVVDLSVRDEAGGVSTLAVPVSVLGAAELPGGEPCFADAVPAGFGAFNVLRQGFYRQEPGGGEPEAVDGAASVELRAPPTYSVLSAVVLSAGGSRIELNRREDGLFGWLKSGTEAESGAWVPAGAWNTSFRLRLPDLTSFNGFFPFVLGTNVPPVPRVVNLDAAVAIDPAASFLLRWAPWSGAATNDRVVFEIRDPLGAVLLSAASDCSGSVELGRRGEGVLIPAGLLKAGANYTGQLTFGANQLAVNDRGPLLMLRAFHSRTTRFPLRAGGGNVPGRPMLAHWRTLGGGLRLEVTGSPGTSATLQRSADLLTWETASELILDGSGSGAVEVTWEDAAGARFFRVWSR